MRIRVTLTWLVLTAILVTLGCEESTGSTAEATAEADIAQGSTTAETKRPATGARADLDELAPPATDPEPQELVEGPASSDSPSACADGKDNDGDGLKDWQYDLGCYGPDDPTEGGVKTRELDNGWTVFEPSRDTKIIYVSSSTGDDRNPGTSAAKPKKSLASAISAARNNHPDWVLLARGDVWYESLSHKEGRSRREPFVIATYGDSTKRPVLKTGPGGAIERSGLSYNNFAIVGIAFYAHTRDPRSSAYESSTGNPGFRFYSKSGQTGRGVLLEDCWFNFYAGNSMQGAGVNEDIVIRRNLFTNSYANGSHAQGLFSNNVSMLLEENVFDHNGWYRQKGSPDDRNVGGRATMYNHNTYFVNQRGTTFRRNIFLRASSIGNKWTADAGPGSTSDIVLENNLYVDGEIGISMGGNDKVAPYRFKDIEIRDNVMLNIGRSRPTNRALGWCIDVDDWDGGKVTRNLCLNQPDPDLKNARAISVEGVTRNVVLSDNVVHGLRTDWALIGLSDGSTKQNVVFANNKVQAPGHGATLLSVAEEMSGYTFKGNSYYSALDADEWFDLGGAALDFPAWKEASGETGDAKKIAFPDPNRSIESYQKSIGRPATIEAFIEGTYQQSKYNWRPEYTAASVNEWIRVGFGL